MGKLANSGVFFILVSIFMASIEPIIIKAFYNSGSLNPWFLIFFKNFFAGILFFLFFSFLKRDRGNLSGIGLKDLLNIASVSVLLLFTTSMIILSLQFIPAVIMLTIFTSTPALVSLINNFYGKYKVDFVFWIGFFIAFLGIINILDIYNIGNFRFDDKFYLGIFLAFSGVISSSIYRVRLDSLTSSYSPFFVSSYIFFINFFIVFFTFIFLYFMGVVSSNVFSFSDGNFLFKRKEFWIGLYGGIAASLANIAFLYSINILGSTRVSILNMLQQPTIILLSFLILKENLKITQILGIILVLLGINIAIKRIFSNK